MSTTINEWILGGGDLLWTWLVLPVVIGLGVYFTARSGLVQLRMIPEMFRTLADPAPKDAEGRKLSVSAFGAFTVSAAARIGVGNIAGVGTAIAVGGAGAVFWMWLMAFIGAASSFVESTLGQLFKVRDAEGYRGGPAYYMQRGLKARWMGIVFAVVLLCTFPFAFASLQANTISATVTNAAGVEMGGGLAWGVGIVLAVLVGLVAFGGLRRIVHVTQLVVPAMALLYLLLGLAVVAINVDRVPAVVSTILSDAFGVNEVLGATLGTVIMQGVRRGMFSNEAGLGSAPNAGATAAVSHPVKQGLVQTLGVYFDTFVVCSVTAFVILVHAPDLAGVADGVTATQDSLTASLGSWTTGLFTFVIFLLAFSSILGCYYYGESNIGFITSSRKVMQGYRVACVVAVLYGSVASAEIIWNTADGMMGLMALVNLIAIGLLSTIVWKLIADYRAQRRAGLDPVFTRDLLPGVDGIECWEDERAVLGASART